MNFIITAFYLKYFEPYYFHPYFVLQNMHIPNEGAIFFSGIKESLHKPHLS